MPDHAFELSFDDGSAQLVEAQWVALKEAGLPSQADHRSMTNAPHLTLVAASPIDPALVEPAVERLAPLLPTTLQMRGLALLGTGPRVTLAHLVEPSPAVADVTAWLREQVPTLRHPVWLPHITLARRVPRRLLPTALEVLAATESPGTITATRLRWWDPDLMSVTDVVDG